MTKKKSGFWTFIFSFMPGAAEMYMGFMKMGVSIMGLFLGLIVVGSFFAQGIFLVIDVVLLFYGFLHANKQRAMDDEDLYALEDTYLFYVEEDGKKFWNNMVVSRYRKIAAAVLILMGVSILWNNILDLLYWLLPDVMQDFMYTISYRIPQVVLGIGIIAAGILLIRGKKEELLEESKEEGKEDGRETGRTNS